VEGLRHTVETTVELLTVGRVPVHAVGVGTGQLDETVRDILLPVAAFALGGKIGSGVGTGLTGRYAGHTGVELATIDRVPVGATRVGADYFIFFVIGRFLAVSILVVIGIFMVIFMMAMVMCIKNVLMRCFLEDNASVTVIIFMIVMLVLMISMIVMRSSTMVSVMISTMVSVMVSVMISMMISMIVMRSSMMISMIVMRSPMMISMIVMRSPMMTTVIIPLLMTDDLTDFRVRLIISPFLQSQPDSPGPLVRQQHGLGHA